MARFSSDPLGEDAPRRMKSVIDMLRTMAARTESDEYYVLDLCDQVLGSKALRQHRFEWLRGDFSSKRGSLSYLPVDGYWPDLALVVEYAERQHTDAIQLFDQRQTVSGVARGEQRRIYDQRRVELVPANGLLLVVIPASSFVLRRGRILRDPAANLTIVTDVLRNAGAQVPRAEGLEL